MFRDARLARRQLFPVLAAGAFSARAAAAEPRPIAFRASDGLNVYAWHYPAADNSLPAILLFHQAGSNHAEYATIAPRLASLGHHSIAIDQRSGGRMWGQSNRTAAEFSKNFGKDADYSGALPDLEAALEWPRSQGFPTRSIVWGSSYSAALVFLIAAKHPSALAAVMAFSPGEYLGDDHSVKSAAARVQAPAFITSARDSEEVDVAESIAGAVPRSLVVQFVPKSGGVHGSSTLRRDRNPLGAEENWQAVEKFLAGIPRQRQAP
jgi:dienelactone hydrolase